MIPMRPRNVSCSSSGPEARASTAERREPRECHGGLRGPILPPGNPGPHYVAVPLLYARGVGTERPTTREAKVFAVVADVQGLGVTPREHERHARDNFPGRKSDLCPGVVCKPHPTPARVATRQTASEGTFLTAVPVFHLLCSHFVASSRPGELLPKVKEMCGRGTR